MGPGRDIMVLLEQRPLLMEGAMGTMLAARGLPSENTGERNLTHPEVVADIHRSYREAGSEVFQSNSFVASRPMLERAGLGESVAEIQRASMEIVREAIGDGYPCGANLGPTGRLLEPLGDMTRDEAVAVYREQLGNQLPAGPDFILFETFEALEELEAAFDAAQQLAPDLPRFTCVSFSNPPGGELRQAGFSSRLSNPNSRRERERRAAVEASSAIRRFARKLSRRCAIGRGSISAERKKSGWLNPASAGRAGT